jgi:nitroimidazol reductase NimA-like FMN-containing flavoprotein (pyridoxamine 5'-phosphate oxidase superfamily)
MYRHVHEIVLVRMSTVQFVPTDATQVRRLPERASMDRAEAYAILDEGLVCHVGFVASDGRPVVIPTTYARNGDELLLHGSPASRMLRSLKGGVDVCVTVTLLDGLVLAKSAFHHSLNYRSVVVLGRATPVTDEAAKLAALEAFVEHIVPGRTADARGPSPSEMKGTLVLALPIDEASVKRRRGGPIDDGEDLGLPVWAGVLPLALTPGALVAEDPADGLGAPAYLTAYSRPRASLP